MKIEYFVKQDYPTANPFTGVSLIKDELLNHDAVVVKENMSYIGILTTADIIQKPHNLVIDCITEKQNLQIETTVCDALRCMKKFKTEVLPVYKGQDFWGLVYKNDLLEYLTNYNKELNLNVEEKTKELQELNDNLEQLIAEKTEELNNLIKTKDKFFSIIAHDLRSPFNTILGFSEILVKHTDHFEKARVKEIAHTINKVSVQTYRLLDNLLEWSRAQRNQIVFNPEKFDLKELVSEKINNLKRHAEEKDIKLKNDIPIPMIVYADINMIKSIFRNLIHNSIKFTEKGGEISVSCTKSKNETKITVKDNGIGMTKEQLEKLFKDEYQVSKTGTNGEKGSGLGLMLIKEFIDNHTGKIEVKSKTGKGSAFTFSIPDKN